MKTKHLSYASDYKAGDRVVVKPSYVSSDPFHSGLEPDKVYTVEKVETFNGRSQRAGGVLHLVGEHNPHNINGYTPGGYGYNLFHKVIDPLLSEASDEELLAALRERGYTGTLEVVTKSEVTL